MEKLTQPPYFRSLLLSLSLFLISLIPLGTVRFPPLVDYPNHLARMHILIHGQSSEILKQFYQIRWAVLPNLAMDVVVPFLVRFMPLETAGKFFIALIFLLLLSGTWALFYALHRRISLWPLIAVMFFYNRTLLWGFLNYLFGLGLMLWGLAGWIFFSNRPAYLRAIIFIVPTLLLFFCHLFALGVYGLCIVGYEFSVNYARGRQALIKAWGLSMIQFVIPAFLFLFCSPTGAALNCGIIYGEISRKISTFLRPVLNYNLVLDISTGLFMGALLLTGLWTRKIRISKKMYGPLSLLFIFFWIMPMQMVTVHGLDVRIPIAFTFLLTAACAPAKNAFRDRKIWIVGILLVIFSIRIAVITNQWIRADGVYADYIRAVEKIRPGSRLFTAVILPGPWQPFPIPVAHVPCLAIILKSAFVQSLFAYSTQQPVQLTSDYMELDKKYKYHFFQSYRPPKSDFIAKNYDYIFIIWADRLKEKFQPMWREVFHCSHFQLLETPKYSEDEKIIFQSSDSSGAEKS